MPVKFPKPNPGINSIECKDGSQRDPDETLLMPCHVCGHMGCRIGTDGPLPCEMCIMVVYVRAIFERTGQLEQVGGQALQNLRDQATAAIQANTAAIAQLRTDATAGIASVRTDATAGIQANTAAINTLRTDATTALAAKASNANLTAVDNKVNTLKTRVDNAAAFPIP